jgi:putative ABC transport system permease protein
MILVTGAGLLIRSVSALLALDPGFQADRALTAIIVLAPSRYPDAGARVAFFRKLLDRIGSLASVESAAVVDGVPLSGNIGGGFIDAEGRERSAQEAAPFAEVFTVSEDYVSALSIPVLAGRGFTRHDSASGYRAVLVNEQAARQFWPHSDAIGKRVRLEQNGQPEEWRQVAGIVKNTCDVGPDEPPRPALYVPMEQAPGAFPQFLVVRTRTGMRDFAPVLRHSVAAIDKDQPVFLVTSMRELLDNSIGPRRFAMRALAAFGVLSLVLAAVGLYGLVSYSVAQRRREIGVRVALGASRWNVLRLIMRQSLGLTLAGLLIGAAGAQGLMRLLSSLLFGVTANDATTGLAACGVLCLVALLGSCLPALQATRVHPAEVLRQE